MSNDQMVYVVPLLVSQALLIWRYWRALSREAALRAELQNYLATEPSKVSTMAELRRVLPQGIRITETPDGLIELVRREEQKS
jgi:hypothetical protein